METYQATVTKETANTKLGILLAQKAASKLLIIKEIRPESLFADTDLQIGLSLVSINGEDVVTKGWGPSEAASFLKAAVGDVTIVAQGHVIQATKPSKDAKVGVGFVYTAPLNAVLVSKIGPNSILQGTALKVGQRVTAINGAECPNESSAATALIRNSESEFTLVTLDPDFTRVTVKKPTGAKSGIELKQHAEIAKTVIVASISSDGIFAGTDLKVGQQIIAINGVNCPDFKSEALALIRGADEMVTIDAIDAPPEKNTVAAVAAAAVTPEAEEEAEENDEGAVLAENEVMVTVSKPATKAKVGISFKQMTKHKICISHISAEGLFADSDFIPGMPVVSINGAPAPSTVKDAVAKIQGAFRKVTIVAKYYAATAEKPTAASTVGLGLGKTADGVVITKISDTGLFAGTELQLGQRVVSINGTPCPDLVKEAIGMVKECEGTLTIFTVDAVQSTKPAPYKAFEWPEYCLVTAKATKETLETKLGVGVMFSDQRRMCVSSIAPEGLLADSDLKEGQVLVSINGTPCPKTTATAMKMIKESVGDVEIVTAQTVAKVEKPSEDADLGITFKMSDRRKELFVDQIDESGLFAKTLLKEGQLVIAINDQEPPMDAAQALAELVEATGIVSVIAVDTLPKPKAIDLLKEGEVKAKAFKSSTDTKIGVNFMSNKKDNRVFISRINEDSIFADTDLRVGQSLKFINGLGIPNSNPKTSVSRTVARISAVQGDLELIAANTVVTAEKPPRVPSTVATIEKPAPPTPVSVTVDKPYRDAKVGIGITDNIKEYLTISKIAEDGLFANSKLKVGMKLLKVNGATPSTSKEAVAVIKEADERLIIEAVETTGLKLGVTLMQEKGFVVVSKIREDSLFFNTDLKVGQKVLTINGEPCPMKVKDAISLLKEAEGTLTIEAIAPTANKVGISLGQVENPDYICIYAISPEGLFANSPELCIGQELVAINDTPCPKTIEEAVEMIGNVEGTIKITVVDHIESIMPEKIVPESSKARMRRLYPEENRVYATASKATKDTKIGINLMSTNKNDDTVFISKIAPESPFAMKGLEVGMTVISINGTICPGNVNEAIKLIKEVSGEFTIVAAKSIATVTKKPEERSGLFFSQKSDCIVISKVEENGLFAKEGILRPGLRVVSVNGQDCPTELASLESLVEGEEGPLTIVAVNRVPTKDPPRGEVTATVTKESKDTPVGLGLSISVQGRVMISKLNEDGLFANSGLLVGQVVKSINGKPCPTKTGPAIAMIKEAEGELTIVARTIVVTANKGGATTKVGLALGVNQHGIIVSKTPQKLFYGSELKMGQKVVAINGIPCPESSKDAIDIVKAAMDEITIEALDIRPETPQERQDRLYPQECRVTASATKETKEQKLGLALMNTKNDSTVFISKISDESPFADSELEVGMAVLSINGQICTTDVSASTHIIKEAEGEVTIVAAKSIATVLKQSSDKSSGLRFSKKWDCIVISHILEDGLFKKGGMLQVGQRVHSVNGEKCPEDLCTLESLVENYEGELTIVALNRVPSKDPIPGEMTVTAVKESQDTPVGIGVMKSIQGRIVISKIRPGSLFENSGLLEGQVVKMINGQPCPLSTAKLVAMIKEAEGELTIVVQTTVATVKKGHFSAKVGVTLGVNQNGVVVSKINQGLFSGTSLLPGQKIISINGMTCPATSKEATELIKAAMNELTIEAVDVRPETPEEKQARLYPVASRVSATATKTSKESKVGIGFMKTKTDDTVFVSKIAEDSPYVGSGLAVGMAVLSINEEVVSDDVSATTQLIKDAEGDVTIVASYPAATVVKEEGEKSGLYFSQKWDGIVISRIDEGGLFAREGKLRPGLKVMSVNGTECPKDLASLETLVEGAVGELSIVAVSRIPSTGPVPGEVSVTVTKESKDTSVGVAVMKSVQGRLMISSIKEDGLFAGSALRVGQIVKSVNGKSSPQTTGKLISMIKEAEGELTIVASSTVVTVNKGEPDAKVGLSLGETKEGVVIAKAPEFLFANTDLKMGQQIIAINGKECPATSIIASETIKAAMDELTIEALDVAPETAEERQERLFPESSRLTLTATKPTIETKVGINLMSTKKDSTVFVSKISEESLFANTELVTGMALLSVNGKICSGDVMQAIAMVKEAEGEITIVAATSVATAMKPSADTPSGLLFSQKWDGIVISKILEDGLFGKEDKIRAGQRVLSINGQECPKGLAAVESLVEGFEGELTIVAVSRPPVKEPMAGEVTVTATKSEDRIVGLGVMKSIQGRIVISKIKEDGLFANSDLKVGQVLKMINGSPCPRSTAKVITMIKEVEGELTIVAQTTVATVKKGTKATKAGLALGVNKHGVVISKPPAALFAGSGLKMGQKILSINGSECPATSKEATDLVRAALNEVTVEAVDVVQRPETPEEIQARLYPENCRVTVTATKATKETKMGLGLMTTKKNTTMFVSKIAEDSPFAGTELSVGMVILTINGELCWEDVVAATKIIKEAEGDVTIVAAKTMSTVERQSGANIGLTFSQKYDGIIISTIEEDGLFGKDGKLKAGQLVVSINGQKCPETLASLESMLEGIEGELTIEAVNRIPKKEPVAGEVTVTVHKESKDTPVGVGVMKSLQGRIVVSKIKEDSLFADTELGVGQVVKMINETPCPLSTAKAVSVIKEAVGDLTLVTQQTVVTVRKGDPSAMVGLALGVNEDGVVISKTPEKLFAGTALKMGQRIISINGEPCPSTSQEATALIKAAKNEVTIVAVDVIRREPPPAEKEVATPTPTSAKTVVATATKASQDAKLGIGMTTVDGAIKITSVREGGLFDGSGLKVGQKVIKINGKPVPETSKEAVMILKDTKGEVVIEAELEL